MRKCVGVKWLSILAGSASEGFRPDVGVQKLCAHEVFDRYTQYGSVLPGRPLQMLFQ